MSNSLEQQHFEGSGARLAIGISRAEGTWPPFSFLLPLARARAPSPVCSLLFQKSDLLPSVRIKLGVDAYIVVREPCGSAFRAGLYK